ncbi:MAG: 3-dehydroquinate synthase [Planctomyces sp.]|nr:3-dehydroquinate synthase [Planctomyces sp.]
MSHSDLTVHVDLGSRSYDICIADHRLPASAFLLDSWIRRTPGNTPRALLVCDATIARNHGAAVLSSLGAAGWEVRLTTVPSGEKTKSLQHTSDLYDQLVDMSADRKTVVIALGGGVVGDLAGFVAATYARGLRLIQIPTTLLSMVDSSVGGKTGINHPRGKNLIGAFHQPAGVLIDIQTLQTLPDREYRSGLAEVVKYGVIQDAEFFSYLENHIEGLNLRLPDVLRRVVARCCQLKATVVQQDEYETTGLRAILNYGHTFGHAFEALAGYGTLLHGEAVAIGMICASRLAENLGRITHIDTERQLGLLSALRLPVRVPEDLVHRHDDILHCMMLDKKTEGKELRFVLPSRIGHVEVVKGVSPTTALSALVPQPIGVGRTD